MERPNPHILVAHRVKLSPSVPIKLDRLRRKNKIGGNKMTKSKKIISIVLALMMVFGCLTMAFAVQTTDPKIEIVERVGAKGVFDVVLTSTQKVGTFSIPVFYNGTATVTATTPITSPVAAIVSDNSANDAAEVLKGADQGFEKFFRVTFVAGHNEAVLDCAAGKVVMTITVPEGTQETIDFKTTEASRKTTNNQQGKLYVGAGTTLADVENMDSQALVATAKFTPAAAAEPKLVGVKVGSDTGLIDNANNLIYGVPSGADVKQYFAADDGSLLTWNANENGNFGTGATVTCGKDTYTFIMFGDVFADGVVDGADYNLFDKVYHGNDAAIPAGPTKIAGDVFRDGVIDGADYNLADKVYHGNDAAISQTEAPFVSAV